MPLALIIASALSNTCNTGCLHLPQPVEALVRFCKSSRVLAPFTLIALFTSFGVTDLQWQIYFDPLFIELDMIRI